MQIGAVLLIWVGSALPLSVRERNDKVLVIMITWFMVCMVVFLDRLGQVFGME